MPYPQATLVTGNVLSVLPRYKDGTFDALITDPPYSSGGMTRSEKNAATSAKYHKSGTKRTFPDYLGDSRDQRSHQLWMQQWLAESFRILKVGGLVLMFSDWRNLACAIDAVQIAGFTYYGTVVWDKTESSRPNMGAFRSQAEFIVYATKGARQPMTKEEGGICTPGVIRCRVNPSEKLHTCGKPIDLMKRLMDPLRPESKVLDPFAGSGSTLIAAMERGHTPTGIELSDEYAAITEKRIQTHQPDIL